MLSLHIVAATSKIICTTRATKFLLFWAHDSPIIINIPSRLCAAIQKLIHRLHKTNSSIIFSSSEMMMTRRKRKTLAEWASERILNKNFKQTSEQGLKKILDDWSVPFCCKRELGEVCTIKH